MAYNKLAQVYMFKGVENGLRYSDLGKEVIDKASGYLGNQDAFYSVRARIFLDKGEFAAALKNIKLSLSMRKNQKSLWRYLQLKH